MGIENLYEHGKDFLIIILKDTEGLFHSEIYEVANSISINGSHSIDEVFEKSKEKIHFDTTSQN